MTAGDRSTPGCGGGESRVLFEACVDSVESALNAQAAGAARVELCANLLEGGTTPSSGMVQHVCQLLHIPVHVIIRPRGGDFCYSDPEFQVMLADVDRACALGVAAIVTGVLLAHGEVDTERTAALMERARPLRVTFHRAFDVTRDPLQALDQLIGLGVDALLTSGQQRTALEGAELLSALVRRAAGRVEIMAGGGVSESNVQRLVAATGVTAVHGTLRVSVDGRMEYRSTRCPMGGGTPPSDFSRSVTCPDRVRALLSAIRCRAEVR